MPIKAQVKNQPIWGIVDLIAPPHPQDQLAKKANNGVLPETHIPKTKILFNYGLFNSKEEYVLDPTSHTGKFTGLFGATGEHVRDLVDNGLTDEAGTKLVRALLSGEIDPEDDDVINVIGARNSMAGDTADLDDGQGEFVVEGVEL